MRFYFCGKYIYTDDDDKELERNMYATLPYFRVLMIRMSMKSENHLEGFFRYFFLTPTQKCHYAQIKLAGEAY